MKLVVTWAPQRTGSALAYLVGMLTLGTALPQGVRFFGAHWKWQAVILCSSALAVAGACSSCGWAMGLIFRAGRRCPSSRCGEVAGAFRSQQLRAAALGYFGHMWELYTFWTLVPVIISSGCGEDFSDMTFRGSHCLIIAIGALGCIIGGAMSRSIGSARLAAIALDVSGPCCMATGRDGTICRRTHSFCFF